MIRPAYYDTSSLENGHFRIGNESTDSNSRLRIEQ